MQQDDDDVKVWSKMICQTISHMQMFPKRVVLQFPQQLLSLSFALTQQIKKIYPQLQIYTLFDSLKNPCCIDVLGAQHVAYDCLFHFGQACFSEAYNSKHFYLFQQPKKSILTKLHNINKNEFFLEQLKNNNIIYIMPTSKLYHETKFIFKKSPIEILSLPFDIEQNQQYLALGYSKLKGKLGNIIILVENINDKLLQNMLLIINSLEQIVNTKLYYINLQNYNGIELLEQKTTSIMRRLSLIEKLQQYEIFGLIISNINRIENLKIIQRCQQLLKLKNKKVFNFLMNNINQCKLGNFAQIQVYVIFTCYNYSLYQLKDLHKLVVTPIDIEIAYSQKNITFYNHDLQKYEFESNQFKNNQFNNSKINDKKDISQMNLCKIGTQDIAVQNTLQTLTYYQSRQYKGLDFSQKKQIKKITQGKYGLAEHYQLMQ